MKGFLAAVTVTLVTVAVHCVSLSLGLRLDLANPEEGYRAVVKENDSVVEVTPRIRVVEGDVCRFLITNKHPGDVPFEVEVLDRSFGEVVPIRSLNCEKRRTYKFDIAAVGCDGQVSDNVTVHISVTDVNEYAPKFTEKAYYTEVEEDRLYDQILQVEATDEDCSDRLGVVYKYEILTAGVPFAIDSKGAIKNTIPLSWEQNNSYVFTVVAFDFERKQSEPVTVTVKVNRICRLGWKGIHQRIEYTPGSGRRLIFPDANLELCDVPCEPEKLSAKVVLSTHHIGKGCDRDTYSVESQRKMCGASSDSADLLPLPGVGTEWTRDLPTDEGRESDQIYEFDGASNAVEIPESTLNHNLTDNFTVAFWMRHEATSEEDAHLKEHIICNSDDHKMNRRHYAIFVRNCRLILLLRREFYQERESVYRPAEWRWKMSEVCDNEWHHYAVSVNFPEAVLFVDGQPFVVQQDNPEIIDDWPLHATKDINTTFAVGACWLGKQGKMAFHFRGFLAGLSVLRGHTETAEVLACLHRCKEGLDLPLSESEEFGMHVFTNADLTEVTIDGRSKSGLENLVSQLAYVNSREFPTPGRRSLHISTTVLCSSGKTMKLDPVETYVLVLQPELLTITINGTSRVEMGYNDFDVGTELFSTISISIFRENDDDDELSHQVNGLDSPPTHKLDSCAIQVYPALNPDHEYLSLPLAMMSRYGLQYKDSKNGLLIYGPESSEHYKEVLQHILYYNRKPAYYLNRAFKLLCSELNGRFTSNEYIQTLVVVHPPSLGMSQDGEQQLPPASVAHAQINTHQVELKDAKMKSSVADTSKRIATTSASHAVTIIIVVCVGFLVFMVVLGVIRIRAAHHRSQDSKDEEQEMAWDDSSLTITVNPMDQLEQDQKPKVPEEDDDSDTSDDGSSYHDDSSEEETEKLKERELEWDDSTLTY